MNPVLSISSPGFQKSSPGFVKHESGVFSSPGPGFSRVRIFFESESGSESGPGFEVCRDSVIDTSNIPRVVHAKTTTTPVNPFVTQNNDTINSLPMVVGQNNSILYPL